MVNQKREQKSTQESILRSAEEEFIKYGYDAAKTVRIAAAAGVTHAMLHYYFGTKKNLFNKVFEEKIRLLGQSLSLPLVKRELPLCEKIRMLIEAHFDFIAANTELPRFIINELTCDPERMQWFKERMKHIASPLLEQIQEEADRAAERGEIRKVDIFDIMIDMVSLNIFPFLAMPIIKSIKGDVTDDTDKFILSRRRENVEIILQRIKP